MANTKPTGNSTFSFNAINQTQTLTILESDLLQGFSDADGDVLNVFALDANNGQLSESKKGVWLFTPDADFSGNVTLDYAVGDGKSGFVNGSVNFFVEAVETAPPVVIPTPPVIEPPKTSTSRATEISDNLVGTINADKLNGLSGNDTIDGGNGNDTLSGNEDDDKLLGGNGDDSLLGDDGDDYLEGGAGNDTLDGGLGVDTMVGGDGDDTYYVDNIGDEITESSSVKGGKDTVIITNPLLTRDNFSAFVGIENFVQLGENDTDIAGDDGANKLEGNAGNNHLIGNGGNDTLFGYEGDDTLEGGRGIDKLQGGAGNDTYILSNEEDTIVDDEGIDIVLSSETITLKTYKNVENLTLTGNKAINGTGNDNANIIEGNDSDNKLDGVIGDDSLFGFDGDDTLIGGAGNNFLDGGNGEADVALYKGIESNYQIKSVDEVWTVIDIQNGTVDELKDIEFVQFSDKQVQLETLGGFDSVPKISVQDVTLAEGNKEGATKAKVVLTLDKPSTEEITVEVSTEDGTAVEDEDYEALNAETITFVAGVTKQTVNINLISDLISEEDENFFVKLDNPQNAEVEQVEATVIIANDDKPSLSIASMVSVTEGEKGKANAEILVSLSASVSQTVTVAYKTTDGTAKSTGTAADFVNTKGTLTFKAGETSQKIIVPIVDDKLTEKNETFTVTLSSAKGALLDTSAAKSKITIVDNNSVAEKPVLSVTADFSEVSEGEDANFTVNLSAPSTKTVTVKYAAANGSAKMGSDFEKTTGTLTFEPGETTQSVFVPVLFDDENEANELFSLKLSSAKEATLNSKLSAAKVTILDAENITDSSAMMITTVGVSPEFAY